ncbi:helicase RepA family protein [Clostridia bacterium OttesenSCG-928-F22]|nr:helicase RepA family protein [Clostridia bacterium OttesenSCG-928-F22]
MNVAQEKMTAKMPSVDADAKQPFAISIENSLPENTGKINPLETLSMAALYETVYSSRPPLIEGLLYPGTHLFVGAPKLGKSFLMAQIAYHISAGLPLWDYPVRKGTVLYLALEDNYRRLQERLYRMFGTGSTKNLHFSISARDLRSGLARQLQGFIQEHRETKLIIIDTLQKVREIGSDCYSYANDYEIISKLKHFADSYGICMLLVHHTRKQQSDDKFDMISGTNGLLGAADGAFMLQKEKRTSNAATLEVSGRDQQDQKLYLVRDVEKLVWNLERTETELWKEPPEPLIEEIGRRITASAPMWQGTPTELCSFLGVDVQPNTLTKKLNVNAGRLYNECGIRYENKRCHDGRRVRLTLE